MKLSDYAVVILAAGKGVRLRSAMPKVLHRAGGRTLIEHVVRTCQALKPRAIIVVVGHESEKVKAIVEPMGVRTVLQQPQRGTGHAVLAARRAIGSAKFAIVLPGDAPLVKKESLEGLVRTHRKGAAATVLSARVANPAGYGRIVRDADGSVAAIVEDSALKREQRTINEINSSMYALKLAKVWPCLAKLRPTNVHGELYLTDVIAMLRQRGETVLAHVANDPDEVLGCNTRADLAAVDAAFRRRMCAKWMESGVTIQLPDTVLIDPDVTVGEDTILEPGVQLLGKTRVGAGCTIRTGSILADTTVADNVMIRPYSVIADSELGAGSQVGPFAHMRAGARLMENVHVGNFVEVKKSVLGERTKAMHLTYLGDAQIGSESNIGAGTITCNYDGVQKHTTTIGARVFIGSDTALVAPVKVGDGAYIGAGSIITKDVPNDALAVARGRQMTKPGWAAARRQQIAAQQQTAQKQEFEKSISSPVKGEAKPRARKAGRKS